MTLNGVDVVNGSVTQAFGTLIVESGDYSIEGVSVRNNGITWTPTSSTSSSKTYNLQSNGLFEVLAGGVVVFSWRNANSQDFTIKEIRHADGRVFARGTYRQIAQLGLATFSNYVVSEGTDMRSFNVSAENAEVRIDEEQLEDTSTLYIDVDTRNSTEGIPASIYVGNVLVVYIERIQS